MAVSRYGLKCVLLCLFHQWEKHPKLMSDIRNMENWSEEKKKEGYEVAIHTVAKQEHLCQMDFEVTS